MMKGAEANKLDRSHFFKYFSDDLLPLQVANYSIYINF